jgi:hypothetical protein
MRRGGCSGNWVVQLCCATLILTCQAPSHAQTITPPPDSDNIGVTIGAETLTPTPGGAC